MNYQAINNLRIKRNGNIITISSGQTISLQPEKAINWINAGKIKPLQDNQEPETQDFYNIIVSFMSNKIGWYGRLSDFHWVLKIKRPFNEIDFLKALEIIKDQLQSQGISYIFDPYPETDLHIDISIMTKGTGYLLSEA